MKRKFVDQTIFDDGKGDCLAACVARATAYVRLNEVILARYGELFPNYVWTDPETAIDLMAAEIKALRMEAVLVPAKTAQDDIKERILEAER